MTEGSPTEELRCFQRFELTVTEPTRSLTQYTNSPMSSQFRQGTLCSVPNAVHYSGTQQILDVPTKYRWQLLLTEAKLKAKDGQEEKILKCRQFNTGTSISLFPDTLDRCDKLSKLICQAEQSALMGAAGSSSNVQTTVSVVEDVRHIENICFRQVWPKKGANPVRVDVKAIWESSKGLQ